MTRDERGLLHTNEDVGVEIALVSLIQYDRGVLPQ